MKKLAFLLCFFSLQTLLVSASSCTDLKTNLSRGKETSEVFDLQYFLVAKGLLLATPNGYFGPATYRAVMEYQDSVSLPDTGEVYATTREAIKNESCNGTAVTPVKKSVDAVAEIVTSLGTSNPSCLLFTNNLSRGDESPEVLTLQNFLVEKGFLHVMPNSYFGPSTFAAVKEYQSSVSIIRTGEVYELTRAALQKDTCIALPVAETSLPAATSSAASLTVLPNSPDLAFLRGSTHVKLATLTLRNPVPMFVSALTLTTASSSVSSSTISNFTITDVMLDKVINGGPSFVFTNQSIEANKSKIYEVYADIAPAGVGQGGRTYFNGQVVLKDAKSTVTIEIPTFSVLVAESK